MTDSSGSSMLVLNDLTAKDIKEMLDTVLAADGLKGADLTGADLTGANLTNAILRDANLSSADLTDVNLTNVKGLPND